MSDVNEQHAISRRRTCLLVIDEKTDRHHYLLKEKMAKRPLRKGFRNNLLPGENIRHYRERRRKETIDGSD